MPLQGERGCDDQDTGCSTHITTLNRYIDEKHILGKTRRGVCSQTWWILLPWIKAEGFPDLAKLKSWLSPRVQMHPQTHGSLEAGQHQPRARSFRDTESHQGSGWHQHSNTAQFCTEETHQAIETPHMPYRYLHTCPVQKKLYYLLADILKVSDKTVTKIKP